MAKAVRIDTVTAGQDGSLMVSFTAGETPLPGASGNSQTFTSRQQLTDAIQSTEDNVSTSDLILFALSSWVKADPLMLNPSQANGKTAQLDLLGATAAIKLT